MASVLIHLPSDDWSAFGVKIITIDSNHVVLSVNMKCNVRWGQGGVIAPNFSSLASDTKRVNEICKLLLEGEFLPLLLLSLAELLQFTFESVLLRFFLFFGFLSLILAEFLPFFINSNLLLKQLLLSLGKFLLHLLNFIEREIVCNLLNGILRLKIGVYFICIDA